uniref:Uncharacterized protein n=1 Tax=Glossina austeni TaxID=7395 RepID=A0A1A9VUI7_GLOAU
MVVQCEPNISMFECSRVKVKYVPIMCGDVTSANSNWLLVDLNCAKTIERTHHVNVRDLFLTKLSPLCRVLEIVYGAGKRISYCCDLISDQKACLPYHVGSGSSRARDQCQRMLVKSTSDGNYNYRQALDKNEFIYHNFNTAAVITTTICLELISDNYMQVKERSSPRTIENLSKTMTGNNLTKDELTIL